MKSIRNWPRGNARNADPGASFLRSLRSIAAISLSQTGQTGVAGQTTGQDACKYFKMNDLDHYQPSGESYPVKVSQSSLMTFDACKPMPFYAKTGSLVIFKKALHPLAFRQAAIAPSGGATAEAFPLILTRFSTVLGFS